jgi:hypothetical protein
MSRKEWTDEASHATWLDRKLAEPHAASMRAIAGIYFPSTVILSGVYREIIARTSIALFLPRREADFQRSLCVLTESIERANDRRLILPYKGSLSFGPLGKIAWILDDGVPVTVPTFAASAKGLTLIFRDTEFPFNDTFWVEYWLHRAMHLPGSR